MHKIKKRIVDSIIKANRLDIIENNHCPNCNGDDLDWEPMLDESREVHCPKCKSDFIVGYDVTIKRLEEL